MGSLADRAIQRQVEQAIAFDPGVSAFDIKVYVRGGIVRLEGVVPSLAAKRAASEAAAAVPGVRRVDSMVAVEDPRGMNDEQISRAAEQVLEQDPAVDAYAVGVKIQDGTAHLVGRVDDVAEERAAIDAVSRAEGVKEVVSELDISPGMPIDRTDLRNLVVDALDEPDDFLPYGIEVGVEADGRVVLEGSARTDDERERAGLIARGVQGVKDVDNRLEIG